MAPQIDPTIVADLYRRAGAERWQLGKDDFARALAESAAKHLPNAVAGSGDLERYLRSLKLDELALAAACAEGIESAWEHFVLAYRPILYRAADAMDRTGGARELADSLYADLFGMKADGGRRQSLFRYFHGRSSLATWLRAVLGQRLVDRARVETRHVPLTDEEPLAADPAAPDPDRARYLAHISRAFKETLAELPPKDRLRLRYYYAHQMTLAQAGRLLHEHEASVSRHLSASRTAIRRSVEERLQRQRLTADQIARCFEYIAEDAGALDLNRLLAERSAARNRDPIVHRSGRTAS